MSVMNCFTNVSDLVRTQAVRINPPEHGDRWGSWSFDEELGVLENQEFVYWIPLDRLTSPVAVMDWTRQLLEKSWVTNEVIGDFARAIKDLRLGGDDNDQS